MLPVHTFKVFLPLVGARLQVALAQAVVDGKIDLVASDHSPAPPELKELDTGDFTKAWGGISGKHLSIHLSVCTFLAAFPCSLSIRRYPYACLSQYIRVCLWF